MNGNVNVVKDINEGFEEEHYVVAKPPKYGENHINDKIRLKEGMLIRKLNRNLGGSTACGKDVFEILRLHKSNIEAINIETGRIEFLRYDEHGTKSYISLIDGSESWDKRNHLSLQFQN